MVLDRRHVRATALLIAMAMVAMPSTASAAPEPGVYRLPSQIVIETQAHPGPNDPDRCIGQVFIEFPHIRNAVSYAVTVDDLVFDFDGTRVGPPFPDDDLLLTPAHFVAPPGFHRFALNRMSRGDGCAQTIIALEGRWRITASKVSMNERFQERVKRPFDRCVAKKPGPPREPITLGRQGGLLVLEKLNGGHLRFRKVGTNQWQQVHKNLWLGDGDAYILETSEYAVLRLTDVRGRGALVGPGMRIRVQAGEPIELLRSTPGVSFDTLPGFDPKWYRVRTNGCVVAARG